MNIIVIMCMISIALVTLKMFVSFLSPLRSSSVSEEALKDLFSSSGFTVKAFKFFQ